MDLLHLLETHFGYKSFRPTQEKIINTILNGNDCLVVMPTGGGKSLCFQVPALCLDGLTLVISPLIALMKDQVDGLRNNGINAAFLNSSQTQEEQMDVMDDATNGRLKLLYVAPERLGVASFMNYLQTLPLQLIAIDEAHCISEWGHDFRPDYRLLKKLRAAFPHVPCIALTATATPQVQTDIRSQLGLDNAPLFLSGFNRTNLTYHVYPKARTFDRLLLILKKAERLPAVVFCFSRKSTESLAADLQAEGLRCLPYHAGMSPQLRKDTQDAFMRDEVEIITATTAFGMGIDKPDIRTVVHIDLPKNIESFYQETGRAGRDGLPSDCILFYSDADRFKQEYFIRQIEDPLLQQSTREKLQQMAAYGELRTCRRKYLMAYFSEVYDQDNCGSCDRCLAKDEELIDVTDLGTKILEAVQATGERFGGGHIVDVLRGKSTEKTQMAQHDTLHVFGTAQDQSAQKLRFTLAEMVAGNLLRKAEGLYPTLSLTLKGKAALENGEPIFIRKPEAEVAIVERKVADVDDERFERALFEELRALRRKLAEEQRVAAFIIFGDRSLKEMASLFPQSIESFMQIYGVSTKKADRYGKRFTDIIRRYAQEHRLEDRVTAKILPVFPY